MTDDLVARLKAGLSADEAAAKGAYCEGPSAQQPTAPPKGSWWTSAQIMERFGAGTWLDAQHIARQDPARTLREVAAKREILAAHKPYRDPDAPNDPPPVVDICAVCVTDKDGFAENWVMDLWPCATVRALAAVYGDDDT